MKQPDVRVTKSHYVVEGDTRDAILAGIEARGPTQNGERFVAYTTWKVDAHYELVRRPNGVTALENPRVSVASHVVLPRWKTPPSAPSDLRKRIKRSFGAIEKHESEHVALGLEAAHRALDALRRVKPSASLDRSQVDRLVNQEIEVVKKKEIEHESHHAPRTETGHKHLTMDAELPTIPDGLSPRRAVWCRAALSIYGYAAGDGNFEHLVDPGDTSTAQAQVDRLSCCELARAGLEEVVLDIPLRGPFVGDTISGILQKRAGGTVAKPQGALRLADVNSPPQLGDGIWWSRSVAADEHVDACVVSVSVLGPTDLVLTVIASGLRNDKNQECVGVEDRSIHFNGRTWEDVANLRTIAVVLDADLYPQNLRAAP